MSPRETAETVPTALNEGWLQEVDRLDTAVYGSIASTPTPSLDRAMRTLARAADRSRLSVAVAAGLALGGGAQGRRAASAGLAAVAVTSGMVNLVVKPLGRRRRPDHISVPLARRVPMPSSRSFPSGHAASAFAFATGVSAYLPGASAPLNALAALVGYSRVHTGVHFPGDVIAGALIGSALADLTVDALARHRAAS
ncbi:MAG: phosphatase PAP2 family protein [Solirubrobacteraceae bacterium]